MAKGFVKERNDMTVSRLPAIELAGRFFVCAVTEGLWSLGNSKESKNR
jgi:hypothetical protein